VRAAEQTATSEPSAETTHAHGNLAALTVGAVGVVFGDIGTSPLYAFKVAIGQASRHVVQQSDVLGIIS
jgi:KUP system potassium uptake protein